MIIVIPTKCTHRSCNGKVNSIYGALNIRKSAKVFESIHGYIHLGFKKLGHHVFEHNVDSFYQLSNNKEDCRLAYNKKFNMHKQIGVVCHLIKHTSNTYLD
jgi:hypothetical protein